MEAVELGIRLYEGKANAVVGKRILPVLSSSPAGVCTGLSGPLKKRKEAVSEQVRHCVTPTITPSPSHPNHQVMDMLQAFIDIKLIVNKPSTRQEKDLVPYYLVGSYDYR